MKKLFFPIIFILFFTSITAQKNVTPAAQHWADSVFNTLNDDQRIAQLMVLRESSYTKDGLFGPSIKKVPWRKTEALLSTLAFLCL